MTDRLGAQGTVCAGGRYDGLIEQIGGNPAPACGFAMGVERLLSLLKDSSTPIVRLVPDAYLVHQGVAAERFAQLAAERLRDSGVSVVLHCGGGSFKAQMKKADTSGARFAVIIGEEEAATEQVTLKPLREAAPQVRATLAEARDLINNANAAGRRK